MTEDQHKRKLEYNRKYGQGYREKHREELLPKKRAYYDKTHERQRQYKKRFWKDHPEIYLRHRDSLSRRFSAAKRGAKERGLLFELTLEECSELFKGACAYCGGFGDRSLNGIDRIDSSMGYLRTNVVSCCKTCNFMKTNHSVEFFLNHIEKIHEHTAHRQKEE